MTYYGSKQLADSFRTVRKNTIAIANEIPVDRYSFQATPDVMSVAELLAHLAVSPMWQIKVHGEKIAHVDFEFFSARTKQSQLEEHALRTKADIIEALADNGETFASFVEGLDEATLASTVGFPPQVQPSTKTRFEMLLGSKEHEMHHRGQLMLIQRLLGQVPELTRRHQAMTAQAASRSPVGAG
jgi:uncharacterized damage-inducible protein DinB